MEEPTAVERHIKVSRTARYFILGEPGNHIKEVWFVCHGQGQLAGYFIKRFGILNNGARLIIAPEGLSRFYLDSLGGRVGAIWMTKEDRLNEIDDYINYLDALHAEIFASLDRDNVAIHILGFSQGVATACRWAGLGRVKTDRLILWAGMIPPDLDLAAKQELFQNLSLTLVYGDQDEYINADLVDNELARLKQYDISARLIKFSGSHKIVDEALVELIK
jgi:predicted esterase